MGRKKKQQAKRSVLIKGTGKELSLSKVIEIDTDYETISFDKLKDGTWRLIYSKSVIDDIAEVISFEIIRHDKV